MYDERQNRQEVTVRTFLRSLLTLLKNKAFLIHALAYSCNLGIYSAIGTLLNPIVLSYFEVWIYCLFHYNKPTEILNQKFDFLPFKTLRLKDVYIKQRCWIHIYQTISMCPFSLDILNVDSYFLLNVK